MSNAYRIEARGDAREVYTVIAASEADAREKFARGVLDRPDVTEIEGSELKSIALVEEDV